MKAPKCKICGAEHWSSQPHHLHERSDSNVMVTAPAAKKDPPKTVERARDVLLRASAEKITKRGAPIRSTAPRAEYQRELMRKRRAKPVEAK